MKKGEAKFKAMGTDVFILLFADDGEKGLNAKKDLSFIESSYRRWEKIFSRFDPESELSKVNSRLGTAMPVSPEMLSVSKKVLEYYRQTEKIFDPRIIENLEKTGYRKDFSRNEFKSIVINEFPKIGGELENDLLIKGEEIIFNKKMDFSGIVKGWATDEAARILENRGWKNFLVDSGGDIFVLGKNENGEIWSVGVEGISEEKIIIQASDRGIATSGITRRKWESGSTKVHHLINPMAPGEYSFDLKSVSVVATKCEEADILAKTLFLKGINEGLEYAQERNIAALFLDRRCNARYSEAMKEFLKRDNA